MKNPLSVPYLRNDLFNQVRTEDRGPLRRTRRAERACLTGERHQVLRGALWTPNAGEAAAVVATIDVAADNPVENSPPAAVEPLKALLPLTLEVFVVGLNQAIQRRRPGIPRAIRLRRACFGHRLPMLSQRGRAIPASRADLRVSSGRHSAVPAALCEAACALMPMAD